MRIGDGPPGFRFGMRPTPGSAMGRCRGHFVSAAVFSVFVNLLMLTGTVLGGAYLAKAAAAAVSGASGTDANFAREKVATTAFYCAHVLPRAHGYLAAMMADPAITMAMPAEAFLD